MLKDLLNRFRHHRIQDPVLGRLVLRGDHWDGAISFPNSAGSAVVMIQSDPEKSEVRECHRRLILDVRDRAPAIQERISTSFTPPDTGTREIVTIDVQGQECDDPQLELTVERSEDGEVRSVKVNGSLESAKFIILGTDAAPSW